MRSHWTQGNFIFCKVAWSRYDVASEMFWTQYTLSLSLSLTLSLSLSFLLLPLWSIGHPWNALFHFSFLILRQSVGLLGWWINPLLRPLPTHRTTLTQTKHWQTSMLWVGFEPTIPAFEQAKTVHALDRAATVIGTKYTTTVQIFRNDSNKSKPDSGGN
jgi:hypothetical protein